MAVPTNFAELAQAFQQLKAQLTESQQQIASLQEALVASQNAHGGAQSEIHNLRTQLHTTQALMHIDPGPRKPKIQKPRNFCGKGSVTSWTTQMTNYVREEADEDALAIAVSYLDGAAHEWWIVFSQSIEGRSISTWEGMKAALIRRFDTLNKRKIARDKLASLKQVKDVATFNEDFLRVILDIPNISMGEQLDRYTRGLKPYIWREMCTNDYNDIIRAMRDAERIEAAHGRAKYIRNYVAHESLVPNTVQLPMLSEADLGRIAEGEESNAPDPMDIGNMKLKKLTPVEREQCRREGRCFRCRQKGHNAINCPIGLQN